MMIATLKTCCVLVWLFIAATSSQDDGSCRFLKEDNTAGPTVQRTGFRKVPTEDQCQAFCLMDEGCLAVEFRIVKTQCHFYNADVDKHFEKEVSFFTKVCLKTDPQAESSPAASIQPSATMTDVSNGFDPALANNSEVQALASAFPDPPNADHLDSLASKILGTDLTNASSAGNETLPSVDEVNGDSSNATGDTGPEGNTESNNTSIVDLAGGSMNETETASGNTTDSVVIDPSPTLPSDKSDVGDIIKPSQSDFVSIELPLAASETGAKASPTQDVVKSVSADPPLVQKDPLPEVTPPALDEKADQVTTPVPSQPKPVVPQAITTPKTTIKQDLPGPGVATPPPPQQPATAATNVNPATFGPPNPYNPYQPYNQPGQGGPNGTSVQKPPGPVPQYPYPYPPYPGYPPVYPGYPPHYPQYPYPAYPPQYPRQNPNLPQVPIYQLPGGTNPPVSLQSNRNRLCFNRNKFPDLKFPEEKPKYFLIPSGEQGKFSVVAVPTRYNPVVCFPVSYRGNVPILHLPNSQSQTANNPFNPQQPFPFQIPGYGVQTGPALPNNDQLYPGATIPVPIDIQEFLRQFAKGSTTTTTIKLPTVSRTTPTPSDVDGNSTDTNSTFPEDKIDINETLSLNISIDAFQNVTVDMSANVTDVENPDNSTINGSSILDALNVTESSFENETISNDTDISLNTTTVLDSNVTLNDSQITTASSITTESYVSPPFRVRPGQPPRRRPGGRPGKGRRWRPRPTADPREKFKHKHPMRHVSRHKWNRKRRPRPSRPMARRHRQGRRPRKVRRQRWPEPQ